ncbi:uncharacterized protein LOC131622262 [Vicia villosa]|uniref:uncharacterized protein LOC131622262 n=1 Tax=Vicia villosa TaxID=3911 RepID=UPI00273BFCCA|nr:uncharacterized protein LOC131622262 [Vicia villosa]
MEQPFENVKDINESKELWRISVCVHHKWSVVSRSKEHFKMILVDKKDLRDVVDNSLICGFIVYEVYIIFSAFIVYMGSCLLGSDIHCKVPTSLKQAFNSVLTVDNTYTIANFHVSLNELLFKPSKHKYVLTFMGGTSVGDQNKHQIPPKSLNFTPFTDILTGKWKKDVFIDLIGMVTDIGYTQIHAGSKKQQINLVLKDLWFVQFNSFEGYALQFHEYQQQKKDSPTPTLIALQYAKVKEEGSQLTPYEKFMYKTVLLPLSEIVKLKNTNPCVTVDKIQKLIPAHGG